MKRSRRTLDERTEDASALELSLSFCDRAEQPVKIFLPKGCTYPNDELRLKLRTHVGSRTDKALGERFGISYNSWKRIMAGQPVRTSLLARVAIRIEKLESVDRGQAEQRMRRQNLDGIHETRSSVHDY